MVASGDLWHSIPSLPRYRYHATRSEVNTTTWPYIYAQKEYTGQPLIYCALPAAEVAVKNYRYYELPTFSNGVTICNGDFYKVAKHHRKDRVMLLPLPRPRKKEKRMNKLVYLYIILKPLMTGLFVDSRLPVTLLKTFAQRFFCILMSCSSSGRTVHSQINPLAQNHQIPFVAASWIALGCRVCWDFLSVYGVLKCNSMKKVTVTVLMFGFICI